MVSVKPALTVDVKFVLLWVVLPLSVLILIALLVCCMRFRNNLSHASLIEEEKAVDESKPKKAEEVLGT